MIGLAHHAASRISSVVQLASDVHSLHMAAEVIPWATPITVTGLLR